MVWPVIARIILGGSLRGFAARGAAGYLAADQITTGGEGRREIVADVSETATNFASAAADRALEGTVDWASDNFEQITQDIQNGRFGELAQNPMLMAGIALATFGMNFMGGSGVFGSIVNTMLVGGLMWAAQRYVFPMVFGNAAQDGAPEPAPVLAPRVVPEEPEGPAIG